MVDLYTKAHFDELEWTPLTNYGPGWHAWGNEWGVPAYARIGSLVVLRGAVQRGSGNDTTVLTLPIGVRPQAAELFPAVGYEVAEFKWGGVSINNAGVITLMGSFTQTNAVISLNGITFISG